MASLTHAPHLPCCLKLKVERATGNELCPAVIPVRRWPLKTEAGVSWP